MRSNQTVLSWAVAAFLVLCASGGFAQEGHGTSQDPHAASPATPGEMEGHHEGVDGDGDAHSAASHDGAAHGADGHDADGHDADAHDADAHDADGHDADGHGEHAKFVLSSTVWAIVSFLTVLGGLLKFVFPQIIKAMDDRAGQIREGLDAAEKARAEAEVLMARHQDDIAKARAEAAGIIEEAKADAVKLKDSIVASAQKEAETVTARSLREIDQAKHTAIDGLQRQATAIAVDLAGGLIEKSLNADEHKHLIEERMKRFQHFQAS